MHFKKWRCNVIYLFFLFIPFLESGCGFHMRSAQFLSKDTIPSLAIVCDNTTLNRALHAQLKPYGITIDEHAPYTLHVNNMRLQPQRSAVSTQRVRDWRITMLVDWSLHHEKSGDIIPQRTLKEVMFLQIANNGEPSNDFLKRRAEALLARQVARSIIAHLSLLDVKQAVNT